MTNYAHIQHLVDEFSAVVEEECHRSPGWFRVSCDRCDWYATGTENYMDEFAWNHMRDFHVGKIRLVKCLRGDLPEGTKTPFSRHRQQYGWWIITPNGVAYLHHPYELALRLARGWLRDFRDDVDFWDPMYTPGQ